MPAAPTSAGAPATEPGKPKPSLAPPAVGALGKVVTPLVLVGAVGLIMVLCTSADRVGFGLLAIGVPSLLIGAYVLLYDGNREPGRRVVRGVSLLAVMWVALVVVMLSLVGLIARHAYRPDYFGQYGTVVTAHMPDKCSNETTAESGGAPAASKDYVCEGSTWQSDGVTHTGTVVLGWDDVNMSDGVGVPVSVRAYVIGDNGYSVKRVGKVESVGQWGAVPLWPLLALIPFLAAAVGMGRIGWFNLDIRNKKRAPSRR